MYRTADFLQDVKRRNFEGFKFVNGAMGFYLTREKTETVEMIIMGYRRDTYPGESSIFRFDRPLIAMRFLKVELILGVVMKKINPTYSDNNTRTIRALIHPVEKVNYEIFKHKFSNSEAFDLVFDEVEKIVYKAGMPFFEKFQTLESAFQYAEQMPIDEMADFIAQPLPLRRMIMKKLCNDPDYETYANRIIKNSKEYKDDYPRIVEALHLHLMENY